MLKDHHGKHQVPAMGCRLRTSGPGPGQPLLGPQDALGTKSGTVTIPGAPISPGSPDRLAHLGWQCPCSSWHPRHHQERKQRGRVSAPCIQIPALASGMWWPVRSTLLAASRASFSARPFRAASPAYS